MSDPNLPKLFLWRVKLDAIRPCEVVASCAEEAIRTAKEVFAEWTGEQSFVMECRMMQGVDAVSRQQMSDKQVDELIHIMFSGFHQFDEIELESMRQIVRDWLTAFNQPPSTSN